MWFRRTWTGSGQQLKPLCKPMYTLGPRYTSTSLLGNVFTRCMPQWCWIRCIVGASRGRKEVVEVLGESESCYKHQLALDCRIPGCNISALALACCKEASKHGGTASKSTRRPFL
jgi:hypothetical protein